MPPPGISRRERMNQTRSSTFGEAEIESEPAVVPGMGAKPGTQHGTAR